MQSQLKLVLRALLRSPTFTLVVVLVMALGIGVNTAIFSIYQGALLRPLPVPEPDRLVNLSAPGPKPGYTFETYAGGIDAIFSYAMFRDLERVPDIFAGIAAHRPFQVNVAQGVQAVNRFGLLVSGSYFSLLDVRPALGRLITPVDDRKIGAAPVAVLGYDYWQSRLAGRPDVVGSTLQVNGQMLTIVGVAQRGFRGTSIGIDPAVYVPITMKDIVDRGLASIPGDYSFDNRRSYWAYLFARLKPGVSMEQAARQLNLSYRAFINDIEAPLQFDLSPAGLTQFRARQVSIAAGAQGQSAILEMMGASLTLLLAVTLLVLMIACANISNLLLARGAARRGEIALRLALGATRGHMFAQLLTESCALSITGGLVGLIFAQATLATVQGLLPSGGADTTMTLSGAAFAFASVLAVGSGILFGLIPARQAARQDLVTTIKGTKSLSGDRRSASVRGWLIAGQTTAAMILLMAAGLLIRSLENVSRVDLGVKIDNMVTFRVSPVLNGYDPLRCKEFFARLEERLRQIPGVTDVTAATVPILSRQSWFVEVAVQGYTRPPGGDVRAAGNKVGLNYFGALHVPVLAGRDFSTGDGPDTPRVAIVNEQFAKKFNLGNEVVGKWLALDPGRALDTQIVGLIRNAKYNDVKSAIPPQVFLPYRQDTAPGQLNFYVRAALPPEQLLATAAKTVASLDPTLPIEQPKTVRQQVDESVFSDLLVSVLCALFAAVATSLAAIGLYGMLAYSVAQRTREIGVRMALGARRGAVAWSILRESLTLAGIGVVIGGLGGWALARVIRNLLFGVEANDWIALLGAGALLLGVAAISAWLPAWRAARIDPIVALRAE